MEQMTDRASKTRGIVAVRAEAPGDVKTLHEQLTKAFEDFKVEHSEQIEEIKKGYADVVKAEKVDRINEQISTIREQVDAALQQAAAAEQAKKDAEARVDDIETKLNRLKISGGGVDATAASEEELAARFFSLREGREVSAGEADVEAYRDYKAAFATYLRRGDAIGHDVRAAMSVGSDPDGGYFVVPEKADMMVTRLFETSPMRSIADQTSIGTDAIEFPLDTNDATVGGWVGETASRSDSATPQVGMQRIPVHEQYAQPKVTQKLLDDSAFDVETWLNNKIADKLSRTENTSFVSGDGVAQPKGFLDYKSAAVTTDDASRSWGVLQYVASGAAGAFADVSGIAGAKDPNPLITMVSKLKPDYRQGAIWAMNRATEAEVRKLKDGEGRYLVGLGDIRDAAHSFSLFNYPIVNLEDMPDVASDSYSIAFGNFGMGYLIVDRMGIRLLRDPYTSKPYIRFYTTKRVGGDVVDFDAIKLMKFAAS